MGGKDSARRTPLREKTWKKEERRAVQLPTVAGRQAEEAHRISENKALIDFGRWIALQTEFCFDEAEDYGEDYGG